MIEKSKINFWILDALTTRYGQAPKYKEELEQAGIELIEDHDYSSYDYWAVRIKGQLDPMLTISQSTKTGQPVLIDAISAKPCEFLSARLDKVDFLRLLHVRHDRKQEQREDRLRRQNKLQRYKALLYTKKWRTKSLETNRARLASIQEAIALDEAELAKVNQELEELTGKKKTGK